MGMRRTPIEDLKLTGSPNLKRALKYTAAKKSVLAHREELEQMWQDLAERRAGALAEIKRDGLTILQERMSDGRLFQQRITHPALKIAQDAERQLKSLARLLSMAEDGAESNPTRTALDRELDAAFAEIEKTDA